MPLGNVRLGPRTTSAYRTCLHGNCMDWPDHKRPKLFQFSDGPKGTIALWEDAMVSPSWSFLDKAGPRWGPLALPSICITCNNAFHGLIEHMFSGPNSLVGSVSVVPFLDSLHRCIIWPRMVMIWVLVKIVSLYSSIKKTPLKDVG